MQWSSGFRVWGLGLGFKVQVSGFRVQGLRFGGFSRVWGV